MDDNAISRQSPDFCLSGVAVDDDSGIECPQLGEVAAKISQVNVIDPRSVGAAQESVKFDLRSVVGESDVVDGGRRCVDPREEQGGVGGWPAAAAADGTKGEAGHVPRLVLDASQRSAQGVGGLVDVFVPDRSIQKDVMARQKQHSPTDNR